ncbi:protein DEK-like [Hydractinia symbiolongicarpus]|uniref:protein DEK-like n=1 Tax=Hydractinia symbiolongicarpus TaxID=13093 RepID=UPI00254FBD85|nr:protein DEK-like [Hydractinia symbiolongicarpus]
MAEILQTKDEQGPTEKMVSKKPEEEKSKIAEQTNEEKEPLENGNIKKNDEDEGESSEEELGSLEKPVEILSRKRERKSTERFTLNTPEAKTHPEDELDFTKGPGVKLGDIPFVNYSLNKEVAEDLKTLHKILYPRMCKVNMLKKNIRAFCGFPFDKDTAHYKKVEGIANRLFSTGLKYILGVLGLEKKGDKEQMKERLLEFLVKPEDLGRKLPEKKRKKSTSKEKKKKSKVAKSSRPKEKHDQYVSSASDSDSDDEDEKEDGNDEEEKEAAKSKTPKKKSESPKKKPGSEKKPAKPKSNADSEKKKDAKKKKPTAVKIPVPKKKKSIEKKADTKRKADDDSEDDEPLVKKSKNEPTDSEIKTVVSDILKDADLEEITMKTVCRQVYDHFPDFDLTPRKDFIKNTVKEIIS